MFTNRFVGSSLALSLSLSFSCIFHGTFLLCNDRDWAQNTMDFIPIRTSTGNIVHSFFRTFLSLLLLYMKLYSWYNVEQHQFKWFFINKNTIWMDSHRWNSMDTRNQLKQNIIIILSSLLFSFFLFPFRLFHSTTTAEFRGWDGFSLSWRRDRSGWIFRFFFKSSKARAFLFILLFLFFCGGKIFKWN